MGGRTLYEHCKDTPPQIKNYTFSYSKQALADLGFIEQVNDVWVPHIKNKVYYAILIFRSIYDFTDNASVKFLFSFSFHALFIIICLSL